MDGRPGAAAPEGRASHDTLIDAGVARLLLTRAGQAALVIWLVVTATFVLIRRAPGDPFGHLASDPNVPVEVREEMRRAFGFDSPVAVQYVRFLARAARGDLGWSVSRSAPVRQVLARTLPNSLLLMGTALLLGFAGGIALGAWQGWRPESAVAGFTDRLGLVLLSVPEFVVALLLVLGPALGLGLFPVGRMRTEFGPTGLAGVGDVLHHLTLPVLSIALVLTAVVARHQRAAMDGVRDREFIRAARARGVPELRIFVRHALRNSLVPVLTLAGVVLPSVLGGSVLVESVFSWPGMGLATIDAVLSRDYHLVVGCVLVSTLCVVAGSFAADLAVLWADPKRRTSR